MKSGLKKIICAVDFSAPSDALVQYAASLHGESAELIVLYVESGEEKKDGMLSKHLHEFSRYSDMLSQNRLRVFFTVQRGDPASAILTYAEENQADMIMLASHGNTAITRLLVGGTAEAVMRHASCPVIILKTPENNNNNHETT